MSKKNSTVGTSATIGRRPFLAATIGVGGLAASGLRSVAYAAARPVKIGLVAPQTGALAVFNEGLPYIVDLFKQVIGPSVTVAGTKHSYEILVRDSESDPNRASQLAQGLILNDQVDVMTAVAGPETVNSVSNQCEAAGVPCVTTVLPLDTYYLGRGAPKDGFQWTYNFFWGNVEYTHACVGAWNHLDTNKVIGGLWPNNAAGQAYAKVSPPIFEKAGYKVVDAGRFDLPSDFTAQIAAFKAGKVDIVQGVLPPPLFTTFWNVAAQQNFRPKAVSMLQSGEFAAGLLPLGERAYGLMADIWWSPIFPYVSQLTGFHSKDLADRYEKATHKQWLLTLGMYHALFDVTFSALKRSASLEHAAVRDAIRSNTFHTLVGPIDFRTGPYPNTSQTPLVMGQWWKGRKYPLTPVIEDNTLYPKIPLQGKFKPIPSS